MTRVVWFPNEWLFWIYYFSESKPYRFFNIYQSSPITYLMTLLSSLFLIKQKHTTQSVEADSQTNDSFESVLLVN